MNSRLRNSFTFLNLAFVLFLSQTAVAQRWHSMQRPVTFVATSPARGIHLISNLGWVIQSWDGGKTWDHQQLEQHVDPTLPAHEDLKEIAFGDSLNGLILGTDHSFHTSDGGHTWQAFAYHAYGVYSNLCAFPDGTFHFLDANGRVYSGLTTFTGKYAIGTGIYAGGDQLVSLQGTTDGYLFGGIPGGGVIESADDGATWSWRKEDGMATAAWTDHLNGLAATSSGYAIGTHDGGKTWDTICRRYWQHAVRLDTAWIMANDFLYNAKTGDTANVNGQSRYAKQVVRQGAQTFMISANYVDAAKFFLSKDSGRTKTEILNLDPLLYQSSVMSVSPNLTMTLTSDTCYYESNDTGATWRIRRGPGQARVLYLDGGVRLAWTYQQLYLSKDDGATWTLTSLKPNPNGYEGNIFRVGPNVLVFNRRQAWITSDYVNFTIIPKFIPAAASVKGDTILMSGYDSTKRSGLIISYNAGTTWQPIASVRFDSVNTSVQYVGNGVMLKVSATGGLAMSRNFGQTWQTIFPSFYGTAYFADALHGVAASSDMYSTIDGGKTWRLDHTEHPPSDPRSDGGTVVGMSGPYLNVISANEFKRSTFSELWTAGPDTSAPPKPIRWYMGKASVDNLTESPNGTLIKVTNNSHQAYWSTNRGVSWKIARDSIYPRMRRFVAHGNNVIAITDEKVPFQETTDNGKSWHTWTTNFPNLTWSYDYDLIFARNGRALLATKNGLYHSGINDSTFDLIDTTFAGRTVGPFGMDMSGTIYTNVADIRGLDPGSLFRSTDNGQSWHGVPYNRYDAPASSFSFAPSGRVVSYLYQGNEISWSPDGMNYWRRIKPPPYVNPAAYGQGIVALNDSTIFCSEGYLWYTTDLGSHWWKCDTLDQFTQYLIRTRSGYLAVATQDRDVCVTVLPVTSGSSAVTPPREQPRKYSEFAIYPNPGSSTIHIAPIPDAKFVAIYSIEGKTYGILPISDNGTMDLSALPAGTYVLSLTSPKDERLKFEIVR